MGDKSLQKQQYIVETARKVFVEKGFIDVTMKDIVEACEISRGGLYLYFGSTEEVFAEVLKLQQESDDGFEESIGKEAAASQVLALFLKEQKKDILRKKNNLTVAIYEYFFHHKIPKKDHILRKQFDAGVMIITRLIETGVDTGEFYCDYPRETARNMMYVIEGLKATAHTTGISEAAIDREFLFLMQGLIIEDE